jgi:hypothetical protein
MPQHDSLIDQIRNDDSSGNQTMNDSLDYVNDSIAAYREKYWHKKHIFHFEYSPFLPTKPNIEKLFVYKTPLIKHFEESMLFKEKQQKADTLATPIQTIILDSIKTDSISTVAQDTLVDTITDVQFIIPIDYFQSDRTINFKSIGIPKALQQLDSFNLANGLTVSVVFGKRVMPVDKTYFYKNEYVKIETNNNLKVNWAERDWLFWPILGLVIYFILTRNKHRSFLNQTVTSVFYSRMSVRLLKEKNESTSPVIQSLLFFYFITTGLFVFMAMNYYGLYLSYTHGFISFLIFSLLITTIYFIKIASIKTLGFIFLQKKVIDEYIHNLKLFNITIGIVLLPIVVCIPFLNAYLVSESHLIQSGFTVYIIIFIFKLIRGFFVSYRQNVSVFYILLYLCTLEILPLALLLRIVTL